MGREIRKVPAGWEHPIKPGTDYYHPCHDETIEEAQARWDEAERRWNTGEDPNRAQYDADRKMSYGEWENPRPTDEDRPYYRPVFTAPADHFQIYENVTEGTPTSPVFASLDDLKAWLISEGYSERAAAGFIKGGWAPSMVIENGQAFMGIEAAAVLQSTDGNAEVTP